MTGEIATDRALCCSQDGNRKPKQGERSRGCVELAATQILATNPVTEEGERREGPTEAEPWRPRRGCKKRKTAFLTEERQDGGDSVGGWGWGVRNDRREGMDASWIPGILLSLVCEILPVKWRVLNSHCCLFHRK